MKNSISIVIACENAVEKNQLVKALQDPSRLILTIQSRDELIDLISKNKVDILIVDLVLKDFETIMLLRELDENGIQTPFTILLSDRSEDYIQIVAYESGVDEIIEKPLKPTLFNARINAIVRRKFRYRFGHTSFDEGLFIDRERYLVLKHAEEVHLPRKEFELLQLFCSYPGKIFSRSEIVTRIWGQIGDLKLDSRSIDAHVSNLRAKIGSEVIKSVKGIGYGLAYCDLTAKLFKNPSRLANP